MVCLRNINVDTLHKGDTEDDNNNTAQQKKIFFLVPWFLRLFLGLFGALIQKMTLDRPHQL
jgi:hypothetical protein